MFVSNPHREDVLTILGDSDIADGKDRTGRNLALNSWGEEARDVQSANIRIPMSPIPSQRHPFDVPDNVAYFNCAYNSPLLNESPNRLIAGVRSKSHP